MIKLENGYFIKTDEKNFILCQSRIATKGKNEGKEMERIIGFYGALSGAFKGYLKEVERKVISEHELDVKTLLAKLCEFYKGIEEHISK